MNEFNWNDKLPTMSGQRVNLRWITQQDAPAILSIFGDPEVIRYWSSPPLADLTAARDFITEVHSLFQARTLFQWGVALRDTDELIGTCTLCRFENRNHRAEIGFAVARRFWGKGYAGEILRTIIPFAFDTLGVHRLEADAHPENAASIRALERRGFRREGYMRERWHHLGRNEDSVFLGLLRGEERIQGKEPK